MNKKKILAITGIRSDYDIMFPVLNILRNHNALDLKLVVSGAHLSDWHGFSVKQIEKDNFVIAGKIYSFMKTDRLTQRPTGVGILIQELAKIVESEQPDFLMVLGDREESIATAVVGNYMNILTVHLGGGDSVFGNADDPIRFAVSKLAHIHFTFHSAYAQNLLKAGEEEFRIFTVGDPSLDNIKKESLVSFEEIKNYLNWDLEQKKYLVLIKHPLSSEINQAADQMDITLKACEQFGQETGIVTVGVLPNTDPGSGVMLEVMKQYSDSRYLRFYKTLPRNIFVNVMRNALCLVGNSSMGILEAPFYELPVINIGNRQQGRLNAGNVLFVKHDVSEIIHALTKACCDDKYGKDLKKLKYFYGDGESAQKIVDVLVSINPKDEKWHIKRRLC